jgi:hypothetical protein
MPAVTDALPFENMNEPEKSIWTRRHYLPGFPRLRQPLFSLQRLRCGLFGLACLATLIALFYAEEDLRGKHAWENYMRQSKAKGTDLDWRAYIPPVPDDQNFAMTPLLKPVLDYEHTTNGVQWRETNWIKRDGIFSLDPSNQAKQPEMGFWVQGRPLDLKEWQVFFRETNFPAGDAPMDLIKKFGQRKTGVGWPVAPEPQEPAADILLALTKFSPQLDELRQASARPYSRFPLHYQDLEGTIVSHLPLLKNATALLQLRSAAQLALGKNQEAIADVRLAFFCADAIKTEPFMVSQMVRNRILMMTLQPVWEGLRTRQWSEQNLRELQQCLSGFDLLSEYKRAHKADCAFLAGYIESAPDDPGFVWWHDNVTFSAPEFWRWLPRGWFYQNEITAARFYQEKVLVDLMPEQQRVFPNLSLTNSTLLAAVPSTPYSFLFNDLGIVFSPQNPVQTQTSINLARIACGLERRRLARGHFPESLDALVPDFLDKLPHDIINGSPLHYRLLDNGQFILYSVGWNEKDDGGTYPTTPIIPPTRWFASFEYQSEKGDWVWAYPAN